MEHYDFKPRIPTDHIRHIIALLRSGEIKDNKANAIICVASATGEIGALLKSFDNADVVPFGAPAIPMELAELLNECEAVLDSCEDVAQVSPFVIALLMKLIEEAIKRLLS